MNVVSTFFLRAKHWQIFLILFVATFVGGGVLLASFPQSPTFDLLNGIVTAIFLLFFYTWLWSMGSFLNSIAPPKLTPNKNFFAFSLAYPVLYIVVFFLLIRQATSRPSASPFLILILPFHLLAMFCLLYQLYFVSKSLVLAETGKAASFYDYAGPFFLIWFFPVGVWFTQPRINRLFAEKPKASSIVGLTGG